jgi:hypothetical protein
MLTPMPWISRCELVAERRAIAVAGVLGFDIQAKALSGASLIHGEGYSTVLVKCVEASNDCCATGPFLGGGATASGERVIKPREMMR